MIHSIIEFTNKCMQAHYNDSLHASQDADCMKYSAYLDTHSSPVILAIDSIHCDDKHSNLRLLIVATVTIGIVILSY